MTGALLRQMIGPPGGAVREIIAAVAGNDTIAVWDIVPEELRSWSERDCGLLRDCRRRAGGGSRIGR